MSLTYSNAMFSSQATLPEMEQELLKFIDNLNKKTILIKKEELEIAQMQLNKNKDTSVFFEKQRLRDELSSEILEYSGKIKLLRDRIARFKELEADRKRREVFKGEPSGNFMEKLEREGMEKVAVAQKKEGILPSVESLTNIMQAGFDEFKKETGRNMSYGEMRDLYG
jgi:hypothetical protein